MDKVEDQMNKRRHHIQQMCMKYRKNRTLNKQAMQGYGYLYKPKDLAYCEVPKVACTFWKRVLRFLNKDFGSLNISHPLDIPRIYTHLAPFSRTPKYSLGGLRRLAEVKKMKNTIMFSRNPYSRLWSAYLDKLVLPDYYYWKTVGVRVVTNARTNASALSSLCGHDLTFEELVRFATDMVLQGQSLDYHFSPVHTVCDPCSIDFTFVGQQEHFMTDVNYIIKKINISSLNNLDLFRSTALNEITSLSVDYIDLPNNRSAWRIPQCHNITLICERLWKVFQYNGYLGTDIAFPIHLYRIRNPKLLQRRFIAAAIKEHTQGKALHSVWKKQKRQNLIKAYRSLPKELLENFQASYARDFELFGYNSVPPYIYS